MSSNDIQMPFQIGPDLTHPLTSRFSQISVFVETQRTVENSVHFILHRYISKERFFRGLRQVQRLGSSLCNQVSHTSLELHLFSFNDVRPVLHRVFIHGIVLCQKPSLLYSGRSFHFYSCRF